jgi:hypothetical protein
MPRRSRTRCVLIVAPAASLCLLLLAGSALAEGLWENAHYPLDDVVEDAVPEDAAPETAVTEDGSGDPAADEDAESWLAETTADCCEGGCDCRAPKWGARAGVFALFRESPDSALLFFDQTSPADDLNASDFDFGYKAGFDVSVMGRFENLPDIELRYMGCDAWNAGAGLVTTGTVEMGTAIPLTAPGARTIDTVYGSKLDSAELNARFVHYGGGVVLLVGFRYLELDEVFQADLIDPAGINVPVSYDIATRNRLYGGQIGAEVAVLDTQRLRLDFVGKVGVFGNVDAQNSLLNTGVIAVPSAGNANSTPVVGEAHLTAAFRLCGDLSLRASYGVMGISDVALATDQMGVSDFLGTPAVHDNGNAFYHGGFVGLGFGY